MPRPKKPDAGEPKSRSRSGCWSCKARKVKCTEERPSCSKCVKGGFQCDYGIRLNWDGRRTKRPQLKAIHLDTGPLMNGGDAGEPNDNNTTKSECVSSTALRQAQSQNRLPHRLDPILSPPSSSSSSFSFFPPGDVQQAVLLGSLNTSAPARSQTTEDGALAGTFQASPPTAISPISPDTQKPAQRTINPPTNSSSKIAAMARQSLLAETTVLQTPLVQPFATLAVPENTLSADSVNSNQRAAKRRRVSSNSSETDFAWSWPMSPSISSSESLSVPSPQQPIPSAGSTVKIAFPPLVGDGAQQDCVSPHTCSRLLQHQATSDSTRLSVSSLLSVPFYSSTADRGPPVYPVGQLDEALPSGDAESRFDHHHHHHHSSSCYFGIDAGFRDLDLGKNNDAKALSGVWRNTERGTVNIPEQMAEATNHSGGYYTKPVSVRIPRALGTLPPKLTENPMNMLYFHHFINNTAHLLVPHDDPQSNPFRTILPQMAINNDNLLSLLLAYSASHRARILGQKEPVMRIALWVQDIFPALRRSLDDHKQKISTANVATAIMLSSLAIVSPTAFGYNIPWQRHLMLARELIAARPEGLRVDHHSSLEGQMCSFLWSWFAYIDVLGGLSGGPTDATPAWILDYKVYNPQDDDENDCIMGFTTRCVYILSQIAELVRRHEPDRLRATRKDPNAWKPSMHIIMSVESLEVDVRDSMAQPPRPCAHLLRSGDAVRWKEDEIAATNEAYHWAALVNLQRRVLGKPSEHPDVQELVQKIINCIDRISVGGTAENCLVLPLFTAGCDCIDPERRKTLLRRMLNLEDSGMMQVTRARALMQRSWETGKAWETLLTTEFIG